MAVILGAETFQEFAEAVDTAGTTYTSTVCGARLYEIVDRTSQAVATVATVVVVTPNVAYKIRANSVLEAEEGTHNLQLRVTFVNYPQATSSAYPKVTTDFMVQVNQASCDCKLITWDNPA